MIVELQILNVTLLIGYKKLLVKSLVE